MKKIVVAGTVLADKLKIIDAYPARGELTKVRSAEIGVGGCVPNVAIDLKRMDAALRVAAFGRVGRDGDGRFVADRLAEEGVECALLESDLPTGATDVFSVAGGERTFFTYAGANALLTADDFDFDRLGADYLHLGYLLLMDGLDGGGAAEVLRRAAERGVETSVDLVSENSARFEQAVFPCLPYAGHVIVNELEIGCLAGENVRPRGEVDFAAVRRAMTAVKNKGVRGKIIVHAPEAGVCLGADGFTVVPSFSLPDGFVRGATGAGDAFCAACVYGIARGEGEREILERASEAAACCLTETDSVSGVCAREEMRERMKNFKRKEICW